MPCSARINKMLKFCFDECFLLASSNLLHELPVSRAAGCTQTQVYSLSVAAG